MSEIRKTVEAGAPGWSLNTGNVKLFATEEGCMLAPVEFTFADGTTVSPYLLTPWQTENRSKLPHSCLKNLRGEFLCLPFGGNGAPYEGKKHPGHGEVSQDAWTFGGVTEEGDDISVRFLFDLKVCRGHVEKTVLLKKGETNLYLTDCINVDGKMPAGHHPILRFPADGKKMYLSLSSVDFGMTSPGVFSDPMAQEYQYLAPGAEFQSLESIPTAFKTPDAADYSVYPSPYGYCDLFTIYRKGRNEPVWSAAVYPEDGYLWFALKDAAVLPATTMWVSNSGRFAEPWSGRTHCIGIEDTCSYFANGLRDSCEKNLVSDKGYPTAIEFNGKSVNVRLIQGVVPVPSDFGKVAKVTFGKGTALFTDVNGKSVGTKVDASFVMKK